MGMRIWWMMRRRKSGVVLTIREGVVDIAFLSFKRGVRWKNLFY